MQFIAKAHAENPVCLLSTHVGGSIATRPMVLLFDPIFGYHMVTRKSSKKVEQITANGDVNILVGKQDMSASCYAQIQATCTPSTDPWVKKQAWRDQMKQFGYISNEDPNMVVLLLAIDTVIFVDMKTFKQETVQIQQPVVLVTGASGNNGKKVAEMLLASKQARVRVGVRDPAKVADLAAKGAEVVPLDFTNPTTVSAAFTNIARVFLLAPMGLSWFDMVKTVVDQAKASGVKFICEFSGLGANAQSPMWLSAEHGKCEEYVKASGLDYTILQPTFFADNFPAYAGATIKKDSAIYGSAGEGKAAYVATEDISTVAAAVLVNPAAHVGKTYVITGPEALSTAECASIISKVIGKDVKYVDLAAEVYLQAMKGHGMPDKLAQGMVDLENVKRNGWAASTTDVVKQVTQHEPMSLLEYITAHKALLM